MDDMTWMSSFYEPLPPPSKWRSVLAFWVAALLVAMGCGGVMLVAWSPATAPASPAAAYVGPTP